jgi:hypothetical protein
MKYFIQCFIATVLLSCKGPGFLKKMSIDDMQVPTEKIGYGSVAGSISALSSTKQTIELREQGSFLDGASVSISPGSLAVNTLLFLEESEEILSSTFLSGLNLKSQNEISSASQSILVEPEELVNPIGSLVITIPLSSGFSLKSNNYAVAYRVFDYERGLYLKGLLPSDRVRISDSKASFETELFGSFQIIILAEKIAVKTQAETTVKPISKRKFSMQEQVKLSIENMILDPKRQIILTSSLDKKALVEDCRIQVDKDQTFPLDMDLAWDLSATSVFSPLDNLEGKAYSRLECQLRDGRIIKSNWFEISSIPPPLPKNPINIVATDGSGPDQNGTESIISWTAQGSTTSGHQIAYKTGTIAPADCNSGTVITPDQISGNSHFIGQLFDSETYAFRICGVDSLSNITSGTTKIVNLKSWTIEISTDTSDQTIDIYVDNSDQLLIDWGDSNIDKNISLTGLNSKQSHTYDFVGTYTVKIRGKSEKVAFNCEDDPDDFFGPCFGGGPDVRWLKKVKTKIQGISGIKNMESVFQSSVNLGEIPSNLFKNTPHVTTFRNAFDNSGYSGSIPGDLFANNPEVTDFEGIFRRSEFTGNLPGDLFKNNVKVTDFSYAFQNAKLSGSIPADIFKHNVLVEKFSATFGSSNFTGNLPAEIFRHNTLVTHFTSTFSSTKFSGSIPANLFEENIEVTDFSNVFTGSEMSGQIPGTLFSKNTKAQRFYAVFASMPNIEGDIPASLFSSNPNITDISYAFANSSIDGSIPNNLLDSNYHSSLNTMIWMFSGTQLTGMAPPYWNDFSFVNSTSAVFKNSSGLTNYTAIPAGWR